ncbi:Ribonuclease R [Streptomyces sp. RB5]|uniref:Ribonuclease R n=1 Tax=Streptomyces smaragdinus TaxID=2585196 RepID=A0A7K0CCY9_9ACTN|nr:RNB domain-containing ribonuclease [Streptomyces smaragdinus]MQY11236.1 Ribonuclease R [Streptomyces smaragdinus]
MPHRLIRVTEPPPGDPLAHALAELRKQAQVPAGFPPEVLAEADAVARAPALPARDATDIPFFTIDPAGSMDLDQAMHLSRISGGGYRVQYAIADVAAWVRPGGALDTEAHRRVTTLYFPDARVPLHPPSLSEGAASLLPDQPAPALLWRIDLDSTGEVKTAAVERALVRSRARLTYDGAQRDIDEGTAEEPLALLRDVGLLREEQERTRGGISLGVPEQEIVRRDGGHYDLEYRAPLPADGWNAQISLLTGMVAADLMLGAGTGILRTLPAAAPRAIEYLRRIAHALDVDWPKGRDYADVIRSLNPQHANHAAFLQECTTLLRGAGYTVFDGAPPADRQHAAVADEYTHATAPLRRLVDRYAGELSLAACAGQDPPDWVREALPALPEEMAKGGARANKLERGCVDLVEAALLSTHIGEVFDGQVVDVEEDRPTRGTVQLYEPAVIGRVDGPELPLGHRLRVRVTAAEPGVSPVRFEPAEGVAVVA